MKTTLGEIMSYDPCGQEKGSNRGWDKLVSFLGTDDLDTTVTFSQILESNGIEDTLWALKTQNYRDYCLFLAEVAESVLDIYEKKYPDDDRPRKCIEGIKMYSRGEISFNKLSYLSDDARAAAWAARSVSGYLAMDNEINAKNVMAASYAASSVSYAASYAASIAVSYAASAVGMSVIEFSWHIRVSRDTTWDTTWDAVKNAWDNVKTAWDATKNAWVDGMSLMATWDAVKTALADARNSSRVSKWKEIEKILLKYI